MNSFALVAYANLAASRTFWQQLLACLNFRFRRFILLAQTKKMISMNYGRSTTSWKPQRWVRFDLILIMRNTYNNSNLNSLRKFISSNRSTEFKVILPWKISQMIAKTIVMSMRILISYAMRQCILFWVCWKVNGN